MNLISYSTTLLIIAGLFGKAIGRTGVTSFVATIPTAAPEAYGPALAVAREAMAAGLPGARVVGVHLEGPFLSPERPGAHRPDWLLPPDQALCDGWLDADPEIKRLRPDIYAVNEDGDKGGKREYCQKLGIEYLVLKRTPAPGLPKRSSTDLRGF